MITPAIISQLYWQTITFQGENPANGRQVLSNNILLCCCVCFPASASIPIILNREIKEINEDNIVRILEIAWSSIARNTQFICTAKPDTASQEGKRLFKLQRYIKHLQRAEKPFPQTCWNLQLNELKGKKCLFWKWCLCVMQIRVLLEK